MSLIKVVLGSTSPAKIAVVEKVLYELFAEDFLVSGSETSSHVPEAPHNKDTFTGALNRAEANTAPKKISIGIESGIATRYGMVFEETWAVVIFNSKRYIGYSSGIRLPEELLNLMKTSKLTHDQAIKSFDTSSERQNKDTWSVYTKGKLSRRISLEEAVRNAVVQLQLSSELE